MRIPAGTLLETMVTLLVIAVVFSISVTIYNNVAVEGPWIRKEKLRRIAEGQFAEDELLSLLEQPPQRTKHGEWVITRTATPINGYSHAWEVLVTVADSEGREQFQKKMIVFKDE